jgi:predicted O-methyltransferase YrrM
MKIIVEYIHYRRKVLQKTSKSNDFVRSISAENPCKLSPRLRKALAKEKRLAFFNATLVKVKDYGAGSKSMGEVRSVGQIYRNNRTTRRYSQLLYRIVHTQKRQNILELGTSLGFGTAMMALGCQNGSIKTVEGCPSIANQARERFARLKLQNIKLIHSTFTDFLQNQPEKKFDFVFVDGHHDGEALKLYMSRLKNICTDDCIFILDDIRWSESMRQAWEELSNEYKVNIDFFRMGLLTNQSNGLQLKLAMLP